MVTHATKVLTTVKGKLMTVDIDDVQIGDIVFMGGHLVRRVRSLPKERTSEDREHRMWLGLPVQAATDGTVLPSWFQNPIGQAILLIRQ